MPAQWDANDLRQAPQSRAMRGSLIVKRRKDDDRRNRPRSLDEAGHCVIEYGVEKTAHEVTSMTRDAYLRLCLPDSVTKTPDLIVQDRTQTAWWLVEIKYRNEWGANVLDGVEADSKCQL